MHGRLKVRTTEEQQILKRKEQQKKLLAYRMGMKRVLQSRNCNSYDPTCLDISAQLLVVNPDIYTLWNYRKEAVLLEIEKSNSCESGKSNVEGDANSLVEELITFLENELKLTEQCLLANPKSYSSWHHRYWILNNHPQPNWKGEFELCTKYLTVDDRNFHCWDYRRLILNKIGLSVKDEINFSTERINTNFSNYSSWHYRSTILKEEYIQDELSLVQNALFTDPFDSSAWFYFKWLLNHSTITKDNKQQLLNALNQLHEMEPECRWLLIAKCWLIESLCEDPRSLQSERITYYNKLQELDSMRKGKYADAIEQLR